MERLNSSPVPPNFRPRITSPYTAFIKGRLHTRFGSAESWSNILCPNIRCVGTHYHTMSLSHVPVPILVPVSVSIRFHVRVHVLDVGMDMDMDTDTDTDTDTETDVDMDRDMDMDRDTDKKINRFIASKLKC